MCCRIEREPTNAVEPVRLPKRFSVWVRESPYGVGLMSLAASVLLLLGFRLWYGETERLGEGEIGSGGAMALHAHDDEEGKSAEHMSEFVGVIDNYLKKLPSDLDGAEQMLLAKYNGKQVDSDGAVNLVGYRPIVSG